MQRLAERLLDAVGRDDRLGAVRAEDFEDLLDQVLVVRGEDAERVADAVLDVVVGEVEFDVLRVLGGADLVQVAGDAHLGADRPAAL